MFLITSGAYVDPSIEADFGRLPPTFLPLGNRRLLYHQVQLAAPFSQPICVSLPQNFEIPPHDRKKMAALDVIDIRVPMGLLLGESVLHVLRVMGRNSDHVRILHGDTLFAELPSGLDLVSVNAARTSHGWAEFGRQSADHTVIRLSSGDNPLQPDVLSGYFAFHDSHLLLTSLEATGGHFVDALQEYHRRVPLQAIQGDGWLDMGDLVNYYRSRGRFTTQRAFNDLSISGRVVHKSSRDANKMQAETRWFQQVPPSVQVHCPTLLGSIEAEEQSGYLLEYLPLPTLSELAVFGQLSALAWSSMLEACRDFVQTCHRYTQPGQVLAADHRAKTLVRLEQWARSNSASLTAPTVLNGRQLPSLQDITDRLSARVPERINCVLSHGDLCFSNVLYDSRSEIIRVIDPRGLSLDGRPSIAGDPNYDIAKLHHSAIGLYDFIIAGEYQLDADGPTRLRFQIPDRPRHQMLRRSFESVFEPYRGAALTAMSALLFFGMLPLHHDCRTRQSALLANALRLFLEAEAEPA